MPRALVEGLEIVHKIALFITTNLTVRACPSRKQRPKLLFLMRQRTTSTAIS